MSSINESSLQILNSFLDSKLHQVIGSTPASLRSSVEAVGIEGKPDLGIQFIALAIFSCSVNKPTVESFFIEEKFRDLRPIASRAFVLNGKVNMTALSLAGHCFLSVRTLSAVNYVKEMRKKIGQDSIWDGPLDAGSIGDTQRKIFREKAATHSKAEAQEFARWFLEYTGIVTPSGRGRGSEAKRADLTGQRSDLQTKRDPSRGALAYEIPEDIEDYWFNVKKENQEKLDAVIAQRGVDGAWTKIRKDMGKRKGDDTSTVLG